MELGRTFSIFSRRFLMIKEPEYYSHPFFSLRQTVTKLLFSHPNETNVSPFQLFCALRLFWHFFVFKGPPFDFIENLPRDIRS